MISNIIAKLVVWALKCKTLSGEQKAYVTTALLDNLSAINIRDILTFDEFGTVQIKGRKLDIEQAKLFRESARVLQDSFARKIIRDQVAFEAIQMGVHKGLSPDMIVFAKAALWYAQEEQKLLDSIVTE